MAVPQTIPTHEYSRVAFHGEAGAFGEEAVSRLWPRATAVSTHRLLDVVAAVAKGEVDAGVLPVENTVAGGVVASYDVLASAPTLHAIAEAILNIEQCLVALPGAAIGDITRVDSHPVALAQCSAFLERLPHAREQAATDTASAARDVASSGDPRRAAIASRRAASRYGLSILAEHIENRRDNQTRFLAVARAPAAIAANISARTSLMFTTANAPGALMLALEPLARHGLNLSKIESRPTGEPWTYRFFADVDHPAGDDRAAQAIVAVKAATQSCRVLGTYPRAEP